jgi:transposase
MGNGLRLPARHGQNDCEMVLGRRNYLFAGSDRGGDSAANIYTLIATCHLNSVEPYAYLRTVLGCIAEHPSHRLDELLPWNLAVNPVAVMPLAA